MTHISIQPIVSLVFCVKFSKKKNQSICWPFKGHFSFFREGQGKDMVSIVSANSISFTKVKRLQLTHSAILNCASAATTCFCTVMALHYSQFQLTES